MGLKAIAWTFVTAALLGGHSTLGAPQEGQTQNVPSDFPQITTEVLGQTAPGKLFLTTASRSAGVGFYAMVLENDGSPYFYKKCVGLVYDFKRLPNGYYTYVQRPAAAPDFYTLLDTNFEEVDTMVMRNGYATNMHDMQMLSNGHYFLIAYEQTVMDMTAFAGSPDAIVMTPVVQEQDADRNVVWQWRFLDHFLPEDGPAPLDNAINDIAHLNSVEFDRDGHILLSNLTMENCMKINRQTGEVMWILGGKLNQFSFVGCDPEEAVGWFDGHDFRRLENGNVLYFDNSDNYAGAPSSHVVEFKLDEENLIAELVWRYVPTPNIRGESRGGAHRLPNGNTMICWGSAAYYGNPVCTEVSPTGEKLFELKWAAHRGLASYRAFRFGVDYEPAADTVIQNVVTGGHYNFGGGVCMTIGDIAGATENELHVTIYDWAPVNPTFAGHDPQVYKNRVVVAGEAIASIRGTISFDTDVFNIRNPEQITICHRPVEGGGGFIPLHTVYDPQEDLVAAEFAQTGEFIITYPDLEPVPFAPNPTLPTEGRRVNQNLPVTIQWSPQGFITTFDLQVATDADFANLAADEVNLSSTLLTWPPPLPETTYYWRVRAHNEGGVSDWSETASFTATAPYIAVTAPSRQDNWRRGLDYFITWEDNLDEAVVIQLYRDGEYVQTIATTDSDGGYKWECDLNLQAGCGYAMKIASAADPAVFDMGPTFRIDMPAGDVNCDGCVDLSDLAALADHWPDIHGGANADLNGDNDVDFQDFAIFAENWVKQCQ